MDARLENKIDLSTIMTTARLLEQEAAAGYDCAEDFYKLSREVIAMRSNVRKIDAALARIEKQLHSKV